MLHEHPKIYAKRLAADLHGCTGWVHNKWNGTVEMEIQGEEEQIDRAIQSIDSGRYVLIEQMDVKAIPVEWESGFRTR